MKSIKFIVLGLVLLAVLGSSLFVHSRRACALPACDSDREFYSDDTFSNQIGDYHVTCQGLVRWGHSSCYYTHTEYGDCGNGYGECGGLDFTCSNGVIIAASDSRYIGNSCACAPVF